MGASGSVKLSAYLAGPIRPANSSWCYAYSYCLVKGRRKPALAIVYKDKKGAPNFAAWYPNTDYSDFLTMKNAKSKGRAVHKYWYSEDYVELEL